jgi:signal transduction histidine kinase
MGRRWGLRAKMAGSYVLVTAAAVAAVEATVPASAGPMSLALLADPGGRIVSSSYPARYPPGGTLGGTGVGPLPGGILDDLRKTPKGYETGSADVIWAVVPVNLARSLAKEQVTTVGLVYVQIPAAAKLPVPAGYGTNLRADLSPPLGIGLLVLLGALPVGAVFGLLSTRRLLGRVRRLAASTAAVAGGDYGRRVPVSGSDEVADLEAGFNQMAERLTDAMATERTLAGASERARIARELHDSISQDLFSLRLLAGGLRRALPAGSPLSPRVEAMERTVSGTLHELQALLLELRPVALRQAGLLPALDELCRAYRDRLGIAVEADLEPVEFDPAAEPAVLRVAQEALANAVRHGRPSRVVLRVRDAGGGRVVLSVSDDGAGFDPAEAAGRHGMGLDLMRERVAELGGELRLESAPGEGTTVRVAVGPPP